MTTNHLKVKKWKFEFVRHETKEPNKLFLGFYVDFLGLLIS